MASSTDLGQHFTCLGEDSIGDLAFHNLGGEIGRVVSATVGRKSCDGRAINSISVASVRKSRSA